VAVDLAGNIYLAENGASKIRRVDALTGLISTAAGNGDFGDSGDGGQATAASLGAPFGVALDAAGNLYFVDNANCKIRRVDINTGIITTVAGNGTPGFDGDGGPAPDATLLFPEGVAVAPNGDIYIADTGNFRVRKVDAVTGFITTIAGSDVAESAGDGGLAIDATFTNPSRVAVDPAGNLYVVDQGILKDRVRRIDAATGLIYTLALFAGTGISQFSGDGGPAQLAELSDFIGGVAVAGNGDVYLSDSGNQRVRKVEADTPIPLDVVIDLTTTQDFLDLPTEVQGSVITANVDGRPLLSIPNLTSIGENLEIVNNPGLLDFDLPTLGAVGGNVTVADNPDFSSVNLGTVEGGVVGSVVIDGNGTAEQIDVQIDGGGAGQVTISDNDGASTIDVEIAGGDVGNVTIDGNDAATVVNVAIDGGSVGHVSITNNTSADTIGIETSGGGSGSVQVESNAATGTVDVDIGGDVVGSVAIHGGGGAAVGVSIDGGVVGDVFIEAANDVAISIDGGAVAGDMAVEVSGQTVVDISGAETTGDLTINADGATTLTTKTGGSATSVTMVNGAATMNAMLPDGTFESPVLFSITRLDPETLPAEGTTLSSAPVAVAPMAAYQFDFAVPALGQEAVLTFEIELALLPDPQPLLDALAAGHVTLGVLGEAPGSIWQTFPVCAPGEAPAGGGCIEVVLFDAAGDPLPPGSPDLARVRLIGITGQFSAWAVVIATPVDLTAPVISDVPGNIVAEATGPDGAAVSYASPTATDDVDGPVPVVCVPASGSVFPPGTSTVTCTASDAAGNTAQASFTVTVEAQPSGAVVTLCAVLGEPVLPDIDLFAFQGSNGEKVRLTLAANPARTSAGSKALLTLLGFGLIKTDASGLPNTISVTLPRTGKYLVSVTELLVRNRFTGDYCVTLESSQNAWLTFTQR
jgi:sugar lactone lactonase YvrE